MRRFPFLATATCVIFSLFVASCDDDDPAAPATPEPTVSFTYSPGAPVAGEAVSFTSTTTDAESFLWSSEPADFTATTANATHAFSEAGSYTVTLQATGPGGTATATETVVIAPAEDAPVVADFSFSPTAPLSGEQVQFTNNSSGAVSYNWSSEPAGFSSTEENPMHTFADAGTYTVTLTATGADGNSDEKSAEITVANPGDPPVAAFSFSPSEPVVGQEVSFTNNSSNADSYSWSSNAGGFSSTEENPSFIFTDAGTYAITLTASGGGESSTITQNVVVSESAVTSSFTYAPAAPIAGETIQFTSTSQQAVSFSWSSNSGGFSSAEENPSFAFANQGSYTVSLTTTDAFGNTDTSSQTIAVAAAPEAPTADFTFSPAEPKAGEAVQYTSTSTNATSYSWSSDAGGFSSTEENPTFTFSDAGTYQVTLEVQGAGGTASVTKAVVVADNSSSTDCTPGNPCDLPACYVQQTVTNITVNVAGQTIPTGTVTSNFEYTTVGGQKVFSKLTVTTSAAGQNISVITDYTYNANAQQISTRSVTNAVGTTTVVSTTTEYNGCQKTRENSFDGNGNLTSYTDFSYNANGYLVRGDSFTAAAQLTGYYTQSNFDSNGNFQLQETFDASGNLTQRAVLTIENCQPATLTGTDASGNQVLSQTNTFGSNRLINKSTSVSSAQGVQSTSVTNYTYQCD